MNSILICLLFLFYQEPKEDNLTNHPADDRYASYSPDGTQILFASNRNGNWDVFLMNADGNHVRQLTTENFDERRPSWHPNGRYVLFESNQSGKFELFQIELADLSIQQIEIPNTTGTPIFASYSQDGKSIAYALRMSETSSQLITLDVERGKQNVIMDTGLRTFYPRWSPDGSQLLFFSRHETNNEDDEIYTMDIEGMNLKRLTHWPAHNFCPSWSPDGKQIAYAQSIPDGRPEIFLMNADGSDARQITYNEEGDTLPNWSPDGKKLLITAYRGGNYEIVVVELN
ncbi:TolB family protein [Reichenbachiella sp.]|uniref:TolB family protein n=1 Tax=Reichenbachiella sp. TaxID=2184521 RepID=UPI003B5BEDF6